MRTCNRGILKGFHQLVVLITLFSAVSSFGQSKRDILNMEMQAKALFDKYLFHQALGIYLVLDSIKPDNPHYMYPIGICYINDYAEEKAIKYFEKCLTKPEYYPARLYYYAARSYHLAHRFEEAIQYYETYKTKLTKKKDKGIIPKIDREIEMCRNGIELMKTPVDIEIVNIGKEINSSYPDYGPVLSADEKVLIFTSNRPNTTGGFRDPIDGSFYEDVYISYKDASGKWTEPVNMSSTINTSGHDASIAVSPDGQKLFIYRYGKDNIVSASSGDLYISTLEGKEWQEAVKLPDHINSDGWEPSASFSADEKILFFASDREGGKGGTDIYTSKKLPNGDWALPVNIGSKLNTPYDEDSPFIHPDGKTLYFSSTGHKSMGGYDIFVSKWDEEKNEWSEPANVGYPLNTAHDDIYFSWSADAKRVYFSTIRPEGQGQKDIYYADIDKESAEVLVMKGFIVDSLTVEPVKASIVVTDRKTDEVIGIFNSNSSTGKYILILSEGKNYNVKIEAEEYDLCTELLELEYIHEYKEVEKNIKLCKKK